MRRGGRRGLQGRVHDFLDEPVFQSLAAGLARWFMFQSGDSGRGKPITPQQDSGAGGTQLASNLAIAMTFMSQQANSRAQNNLLRRGPSSHPRFQLGHLFRIHCQRFSRVPHAAEYSRLSLIVKS